MELAENCKHLKRMGMFYLLGVGKSGVKEDNIHVIHSMYRVLYK